MGKMESSGNSGKGIVKNPKIPLYAETAFLLEKYSSPPFIPKVMKDESDTVCHRCSSLPADHFSRIPTFFDVSAHDSDGCFSIASPRIPGFVISYGQSESENNGF